MTMDKNTYSNQGRVSPALYCLFSLAQLFLLELEGVQVIIPATAAQQLLVIALLQNLAVGQHDNVVRMLNGA